MIQQISFNYIFDRIVKVKGKVFKVLLGACAKKTADSHRDFH